MQISEIDGMVRNVKDIIDLTKAPIIGKWNHRFPKGHIDE